MGKPKQQRVRCSDCDVGSIFLSPVRTCGNVRVAIGHKAYIFAPNATTTDVEKWLNEANIGNEICRKGLANTIANKLSGYQ